MAGWLAGLGWIAMQAAAQAPTPPPPVALPGDRIVTAEPDAEALALGRALAESGTLASLLPLVIAKDTAELVAEHMALTPAERERLRAIAARVGAEGTARLMTAHGRAYAQRLTLAELRELAAQIRSPAWEAYRKAQPGAIAATMASVGSLDFKADVRKALCAEMGKGCGD